MSRIGKAPVALPAGVKVTKQGKTVQVEGPEGKTLVLNVGFAHPVKVPIPAGLTVECPKPTEIFIRGVDKQMVGEFAAVARKVRPPEPYNAKGIKYGEAKDQPSEQIKRKAGK